jgi:hypothetical protein
VTPTCGRVNPHGLECNNFGYQVKAARKLIASHRLFDFIPNLSYKLTNICVKRLDLGMFELFMR